MQVIATGLTVSLDPSSGQLRVAFVAEGSPAEAAGVREGDVILEINGEQVDMSTSAGSE